MRTGLRLAGCPGSSQLDHCQRCPQTLPSLSRSVDWLGDDDDDDGWPTTVSRTQPLSPQRLVCPKTHPPRGRNSCQNRPTDQRKDCPRREKWLLRLQGPLEAARRGLGRGRKGALNNWSPVGDLSADPLAHISRRWNRYISRMLSLLMVLSSTELALVQKASSRNHLNSTLKMSS
jgi:hypothetical protein